MTSTAPSKRSIDKEVSSVFKNLRYEKKATKTALIAVVRSKSYAELDNLCKKASWTGLKFWRKKTLVFVATPEDLADAIRQVEHNGLSKDLTIVVSGAIPDLSLHVGSDVRALKVIRCEFEHTDCHERLFMDGASTLAETRLDEWGMGDRATFEQHAVLLGRNILIKTNMNNMSAVSKRNQSQTQAAAAGGEASTKATSKGLNKAPSRSSSKAPSRSPSKPPSRSPSKSPGHTSSHSSSHGSGHASGHALGRTPSHGPSSGPSNALVKASSKDSTQTVSEEQMRRYIQVAEQYAQNLTTWEECRDVVSTLVDRVVGQDKVLVGLKGIAGGVAFQLQTPLWSAKMAALGLKTSSLVSLGGSVVILGTAAAVAVYFFPWSDFWDSLRTLMSIFWKWAGDMWDKFCSNVRAALENELRNGPSLLSKRVA
ncbi:hypothetical protein CMQ_3699 [Grosmannia clavigera kw1407]|uniref:Uncharacterized protein n=1 Tax=Grosmannia clavigera (strain kw1407 / UAMH 11150) TaxID=655863 RepID=F0X8C6_GROCL|nr:uncharacterized protein CMQ_3699 [Grosmannia clavigera kw1407]EFX05630.1 hypothetical protein CMQ_3699 [Grosmannia clavigera kw1407]